MYAYRKPDGQIDREVRVGDDFSPPNDSTV